MADFQTAAKDMHGRPKFEVRAAVALNISIWRPDGSPNGGAGIMRIARNSLRLVPHCTLIEAVHTRADC